MQETEIKRLIVNLGEAIHETLDDSPKIREHIQKIQTAGYEVILVIEAKVGLNDKKNVQAIPNATEEPVRLRITDDDVKFLQSLKIFTDNDL